MMEEAEAAVKCDIFRFLSRVLLCVNDRLNWLYYFILSLDYKTLGVQLDFSVSHFFLPTLFCAPKFSLILVSTDTRCKSRTL